jgi:transcriptional regulator of acetoin/glycerol metabolism
MTLKEIEKTAIQQALMRNNWKKMVTARELGIDKNTLRRTNLRASHFFAVSETQQNGRR